ncbi:uncharacterized protein LOC105194479 [Solenopsis invicta]|uniref:uncharacterized protein LOC105194479 n=1 Tax=Solenopsis invicta TaxID=13686 RepID=UPI0005963077|nr:uncharacterized protein LOC105194479 [Solenopsis invicta]
MLQTLKNVTFVALLMQLNINFYTDFWGGLTAISPIQGPYPRIPDRDKLKREIAFAEECRQYIKAPKATVN